MAGRAREEVVALDVRRGSERAVGFVEGSVHIPIHTLHRRLDEITVRMLRSRRAAEGAVTVRPGRAAAAGAGLGAVTGVLGVGGGFLPVPALVGVLGMRMRNAVATSLLVITVSSLAALATRAGTVEGPDWAVVGPFVGAAILGAWDGKKLSAKISGHTLQRIFALVLLAVAAFMLVDALV